jgi:hypothetical protein
MAATDQIKRLADLAAAMRLGRELIGHDRWAVEQLEAFQRRRLGELVRHATAEPRSTGSATPAWSSATRSSCGGCRRSTRRR